MIRHLYVCAFAALAWLGTAIVARPASLWARSQGLGRAAPAWDVPSGAVLLGAAVLLALLTLRIAFQVALRRKPGIPLHGAFLMAVGTCFALRQAAGDPRPAPDPGPALLEALRGVADELDGAYAGQYSPDATRLASRLAQLPPLPLRHLGRRLRVHARILAAADGPQLEQIQGDQPGTLYLAISKDRQSAWLTALTLDGIVHLSSNEPAVAEARRGTHSLPGNDPAVPVYPRALPGR